MFWRKYMIKWAWLCMLLSAAPFLTAYGSNFSQGQQAFFKSDYAEAITCFKKALHKRPNNPVLHFSIGQSYVKLKDNANAKKYFQKALEFKDNYGLARLNLARVLHLLGEDSSSLKQYKILQKKHPQELHPKDNALIKRLSVNGSISVSEMPVTPKEGQEISPAMILPNYYAILIGVEEYQDPAITDLDKPMKDINALKQLLISHFTFSSKKVLLLKNPSRKRIVNMFYGFSKMLTKDDSLLIFYAGHGYWDEKLKIGYWLPADAQKNSRATWLSNNTVRDYIKGINSRHTLLIADACFSGGIFKTRKAFDQLDSAIESIYKMTSRKAMTSGTLTQVPDESVFLKYFLKRLLETDQKYITSLELFNAMRRAVINNSVLNQVPQYGTIHGCGDEGGDFVFMKR